MAEIWNEYTFNSVARICRRLAWTGWIVLIAGAVVSQSRDSGTRSGARRDGTLAREMLTTHNAVRAEAKLPPLQWSSSLAAFSQKWANTLLARNRTAHNPNSPYGENILITGVGFSPSLVVREWASESTNYRYRSNTCRGDCGHYTQIVWRDTRRVGCAVARGARREVWVCSYDPPGNYEGEWPY